MSNIEQRIQFFRMVRDIPYFISLSDDVQDYCCATKPYMLAQLLASIGIESRRMTCTFNWDCLPLPKDLLERNPDDSNTHEYLEVFIPETSEWEIVDPSWDMGLEKAGFPIANWDGTTSTKMGVEPEKIYSVEESAAFIKEYEGWSAEVRQRYLEERIPFLNALNIWIVEQRK